MKPISILTKDFKTGFAAGKYLIDVLGGWSVTDHSFRIVITNLASGEKVKIMYAQWPVQSFESGKRAKRRYEIEITEPGEYSIEFINPESLEVKRSNLPIFSLFFKSIPASEISIYIHKKF